LASTDKNPCSPYLSRPLRSLEQAVRDVAARHRNAPEAEDDEICYSLSGATTKRHQMDGPGRVPAAPKPANEGPLHEAAAERQERRITCNEKT